METRNRKDSRSPAAAFGQSVAELCVEAQAVHRRAETDPAFGPERQRAALAALAQQAFDLAGLLRRLDAQKQSA